MCVLVGECVQHLYLCAFIRVCARMFVTFLPDDTDL